MTTAHIPPGWHAVTPRLVVKDPRELAAFLSRVFEASVESRQGAPLVVTIGDSKLMVSEIGDREAHRTFLYVYVADADAAYERALEEGARSIEKPFDTPYGDRRCMIEDRWGNTWQIAVHAGNAA